MSYAKQMAEISAAWAAANPPPGPVMHGDLAKIALPAGCRSADDYLRWASSIAAPNSAKLSALAEWCIAWHRSGRNVFDLSPSFVAAMVMTDISALAADIRLPFPALLIDVPSGFVRGAEGGDYTKIHVQERQRGDGSRALSVKATDGEYCLAHTVEAASLTWEEVERELADDGPPHHGYVAIDSDEDRLALRTVMRITLGMLGYVSAVRDAVAPHAGHQPPRRPVTEAHAVPHWQVGRTVRVDPRLVQAARSGSREIAFRIKHRFIVRGHYRNQACGPGLADRRTQWIAPHWKGPEEGAQIVHTYKPKAPAEDS
jgi:hypothetical protein